MSGSEYLEIKVSLSEDFREFVDVHAYSKVQVVAALLEDNVLMMRKSNDYYVSVIIIISIISLKSNIISLRKIIESNLKNI